VDNVTAVDSFFSVDSKVWAEASNVGANYGLSVWH
jgi:hypothetical protein